MLLKLMRSFYGKPIDVSKAMGLQWSSKKQRVRERDDEEAQKVLDM